MNLEERIKAGMLFYESGHVDPVNQEIEERLKNERKDCKELMFDYNHCRPGDQDRPAMLPFCRVFPLAIIP